VLRVAPHLHALGAVGIEGPVGVLRGLHIAPAAAAAPIAPTLALHTLEISHILKTVRLFPERQFGGLAFSLASILPDQIVEDVCVPRLPPWSSSARGLFEEASRLSGRAGVLHGDASTGNTDEFGWRRGDV
jgi:hypothetical protein